MSLSGTEAPPGPAAGPLAVLEVTDPAVLLPAFSSPDLLGPSRQKDFRNH